LDGRLLVIDELDLGLDELGALGQRVGDATRDLLACFIPVALERDEQVAGLVVVFGGLVDHRDLPLLLVELLAQHVGHDASTPYRLPVRRYFS
jgi:hypothetical protein